MNELQLKLVEALRHTAERFRKGGLPAHLTAQMQQLATKVDEPCVVAVVGRVKAGKSTFVNALLGEDLAKMGATETTATINYFRHGTPDPNFPVRCYWRTSKLKVTDESRTFLDSLQGRDKETLRRAADIDHLEYLVPSRYLEQITLVDTPGTGAAVTEHQQRVEEFVNISDPLYDELKKRHHDETERIGSAADAVIYLIGVTARITDEFFLKQFLEATGDKSRAYNAIGVMAQIDLNDQIVERREELSEKVASQLQHRLNTVIPVSAGIQRALNNMLEDRAGLKEMMTIFRRDPPLPAEVIDNLLSDSEAYDDYEAFFDTDKPCPVTPEQRKQVRGKRGKDGEPDEVPWKVFATIVRAVTDPSLADETAIVQKLQDIAGFERLRTVLEHHFIRRGSLLCGYNIVNKALKLLEEIKDSYLREFREREAENTTKRERFVAFLQHMPNNAAARELEEFVQQQLAPRADMGVMLDEVEREIAHIKYELEDYNADFKALQQIEEHMDLFEEKDRSELQLLFGLHSLESEKRLQPSHVTFPYIEERQAYWERKMDLGREPIVVEVAEQAVRRYGLVAESLN